MNLQFSWAISILSLAANIQIIAPQIVIPFLDWSESLEPVQVADVRHDRIDINWRIPEEFANATARQRLMVTDLKENNRKSRAFQVDGATRNFTFHGLQGNTTYRVSVEAFSSEGTSLWYKSDMTRTSLAALDWLPPPLELAVVSKSNDSLEITWSPPDMSASQHHIVINQYFINIYEFYPETQTFTKKVSTSIAIPKTSYLATRLNPGAVYNVTLQAGTTFGYGSAAWTATNTLVPGLAYILKQKARTPNSLTVAWPSAWMATPNAKFTILAKTVHSNERVQKEIMEAGFIEAGRNSEFQLKNLAPGSTYNVTLVTAMEQDKSKGKWLKPGQMKSTWGIFSTLVQGEYTIPEARVASETDTAASIVFQPLTVASNIVYQIRNPRVRFYQMHYVSCRFLVGRSCTSLLRYATIDQHSDDPIIETRELKDEDLRCPKFGCEWKCFLFFNLKRRPREYTFSVRAKVDGVWNKWSPILRRQWNLLERPCSINPPSVFVEFIGNAEHQRILELKSAIRVDLQQHDTWRYLVVIDSRTANIATMDLTKLADKVTADYDHIPYYITASLTPEEVEEVAEFRLGDGRVYGGYLNYPLENADANPQYTLIPMSQQENEIMEPRLRSCGFTEQGVFECDMGLIEIVSYIPDWMKATIAVIIALAVASCCCCYLCCMWKNRQMLEILPKAPARSTTPTMKPELDNVSHAPTPAPRKRGRPPKTDKACKQTKREPKDRSLRVADSPSSGSGTEEPTETSSNIMTQRSTRELRPIVDIELPEFDWRGPREDQYPDKDSQLCIDPRDFQQTVRPLPEFKLERGFAQNAILDAEEDKRQARRQETEKEKEEEEYAALQKEIADEKEAFSRKVARILQQMVRVNARR